MVDLRLWKHDVRTGSFNGKRDRSSTHDGKAGDKRKEQTSEINRNK